MLRVKRELRRAKLFEVQKLTKRARALEAKRGSEVQVQKNKRKAQRCREELEHIKEMNLSDLTADALKGAVAVNSKPPDNLLERARWRLLSSKGLSGAVSKVQLKKVKDLVRGYKAPTAKDDGGSGGGGGGDGGGDGGVGSNEGDDDVSSDDGENPSFSVGDGGGISDGGSDDHINDGGSDDHISGGGSDDHISDGGSGGGDSDRVSDSGDDVSEGEDSGDNGSFHGDLDLGGSTDGGSVADEDRVGGAFVSHRGGPTSLDTRPLLVNAKRCTEDACKGKAGLLNAAKKMSVGSTAFKNQQQLSAGGGKGITEQGAFCGKRQKTGSLFVSTLREGKAQKQHNKKASASKKSNRLGQRARRRMWEELHGPGAKHLKGQSAGVKPVKGSRRNVQYPVSSQSTSKIAASVSSPTTNLHPSWEASKRRKRQETGITEFKGQRIVFSEA